MYNVFTDFHHAGLLQSLILLFERRLGGRVYRPIGTEWHTNGFWKVYDHPATVEQFLGINGATPDGTPPLNEVVGKDALEPPRRGKYFCHDIDSGQTNRAITYEAFMDMKIDIVIASLPYHVKPFWDLCNLHPSRPKLIYQIGNQWDGNETALNIMASAKIAPIEGTNFISYHQEFDLDIFKPNEDIANGAPYAAHKNIFSFVNVFGGQDHFASDWGLFQNIEQKMSDWTFRSYGGQCRDGAIGPSDRLADKLKEARFIWHTKQGGDGYGHIIHNAPAVGRPLIVKKEYYRGKMAEPLLEDGVTCLTIDGLSIDEMINKIVYYNDQERYTALCQNAYNRFKEIVDFDREQKEIELFLSRLL